MEKKDYKETMREIFRIYNKKPKGWQVLVGRSPRGPYNILFSNPDYFWLIKVDTIYKPNPIGFGVRLKELPEIPSIEAPSYGFRSVQMNLIKEMMKFGLPLEMIMEEVIKRTLENPPMPVSRIKTPITTIGPYIHTPKLELVSEKQRKLSKKLDEELMKLVQRKYSFYG